MLTLFNISITILSLYKIDSRIYQLTYCKNKKKDKNMPTINQLIKHPRTDKVKKSKVPAMQQNPQNRGVSTRV